MKWVMTIRDVPRYVSFHWNTRVIEITNYGCEIVYIGVNREVNAECGIPLMPVPEGRKCGGSLTLTRVAETPVRGLYLVCCQKDAECEIEVIWTEG